MKYIKEYEIFENNMINEKISWKELLLMIGILYAGQDIKQNYELHNQLKGMYQDINSPKSDPHGRDSVRIEEVRDYLISRVLETDQFKRFNQKWVADSLKSVHFKVLDNMANFQTSDDRTRACYMYLPSIKRVYPTHSRFLDAPSIQNVIIVDRDDLYDDDYLELITHELYHYLDKLLGAGDLRLSDKLDMESFIDKKFMKDKEYSLRKFASGYGMSLEELPPKKVESLYALMSEFMSPDLYDYISLPGEIFTRWKTFKSKLLDKGYIKDINQTVELEDISSYFGKEKDIDEDMSLFLILDLNKLKDLDKALN